MRPSGTCSIVWIGRSLSTRRPPSSKFAEMTPLFNIRQVFAFSWLCMAKHCKFIIMKVILHKHGYTDHCIVFGGIEEFQQCLEVKWSTCFTDPLGFHHEILSFCGNRHEDIRSIFLLRPQWWKHLYESPRNHYGRWEWISLYFYIIFPDQIYGWTCLSLTQGDLISKSTMHWDLRWLISRSV